MKYTVHVKAEDYIEVEADSRDEAHRKAIDVAGNIAKVFEWDSEVVLERE